MLSCDQDRAAVTGTRGRKGGRREGRSIRGDGCGREEGDEGGLERKTGNSEEWRKEGREETLR